MKQNNVIGLSLFLLLPTLSSLLLLSMIGCRLEPRCQAGFLIPLKFTGGDSLYLGQPQYEIRERFRLSTETYDRNIQWIGHFKERALFQYFTMNEDGAGYVKEISIDFPYWTTDVIDSITQQIGPPSSHSTERNNDQHFTVETTLWTRTGYFVSVYHLLPDRSDGKQDTTGGLGTLTAKCIESDYGEKVQ